MGYSSSTYGDICALICKMLTIVDTNISSEGKNLFEKKMASKLKLTKEKLLVSFFSIDFMMLFAGADYHRLPPQAKTVAQINLYSGVFAKLSDNEQKELIRLVKEVCSECNLDDAISESLQKWLLFIYQSNSINDNDS